VLEIVEETRDHLTCRKRPGAKERPPVSGQ